MSIPRGAFKIWLVNYLGTLCNEHAELFYVQVLGEAPVGSYLYELNELKMSWTEIKINLVLNLLGGD